MELLPVALDDKYTLESGRVFISSIQALVRLPMMQRRADRAAGLNTAGFISGYPGSPLGGYDLALARARKHLAAHDIRFQPGVNEEIAATAVAGTQQVNLFPGAKVDGVFAIWYGKGPGLDRAMDALKHGNIGGSSPRGGVVVVVGDDHGANSSTLAYHSETELQAAMIPIIVPAGTQDFLDLGLLAFAASRYTGLWMGFKTVADTVETQASVEVGPDRVRIVAPADHEPPPEGLNLRWPDRPQDAEARTLGPRQQALAAFARANRFDRLVVEAKVGRLGIAAAGKSWQDVCQALDELGIDGARAERLGIRLYKLGLTWPLETEGFLRFADGLGDLLIVEEKRGLVEEQALRLLYHLDAARRPRIAGKTDETGRALFPTSGEITPAMVARAILDRLDRHGGAPADLRERLARIEAAARPVEAPATAQRPPFFCSGCPHNSSTKVPDGSRAIASIGCHTMAIYMPARHTITFTQMGGEGASWIGQAPFSADRHVFQNLGDGGYAHSGILAMRAAAAAGVNITYKLLVNDAIAMTGGQPVEARSTIADMTREVAAIGARRIVVVSDDPERHPDPTRFASGTQLRHRDDLMAVEEELREVEGLSVLIYDQTCAAEKRRRRKRGQFPDPERRLFINEAVCEGCGDCQEESNCIAVAPVETELGRKRAIDQSACNKDYSCVKGFCPSFVSVEGARLRRSAGAADAVAMADPAAGLPEPEIAPLAGPCSILVAGIGGSGIVTVGALLGMAAHLEGKGCSILDFTGLAQKNGAVSSHVRLAPSPADLPSARIAAGGADLLLGCDMVVAAMAPSLSRLAAGRSRAIVNRHLQPNAAFVLDGDTDFQAALLRRALETAAGRDNLDVVDATGLATALMGDAIAANPFLLGYAWQKGLIPLSLAALDRAIELNDVAVAFNRRAFAWGRRAAHDPASLPLPAAAGSDPEPALTVGELIERRAALLARWQDQRWAARYRAFMAEVERTERARTGRDGLTRIVAANLARLMSYKDEYEVARLYLDPAFRQALERQFEGEPRLKLHLAPPLFAGRDPATGHLRKRAYGPWVFKVFRLLAPLKRLRGTRFDPFGHTAERRAERALIEEYRALVEELLAGLTPDRHPLACEIAALPAQVRGFGHVKERAILRMRERREAMLTAWRNPLAAARAAQ